MPSPELMRLPVILPNGMKIGTATSADEAAIVLRTWMDTTYGYRHYDGRSATALLCACLDDVAQLLDMETVLGQFAVERVAEAFGGNGCDAFTLQR